MTTITRSQQLATTAIELIGMTKATGASSADPTSAAFKRGAARFMGDDAVFTRAIEAEDASVGIETANMVIENGEATEFDAVASVGSERIVFHPRERCLVREVMDIRPETVDLSVVNAQKGVPFYREHIHSDFYQLGRVSSFDVEAGRIIARKIRLSLRDDVKGYRQDVARGIMRGVSLGYKHLAYTMEEPAQAGDFPICRVNKILIVELSSTSMPADIYCGIIEASIRSAYPNDDAPDAVIATRSASADGTTANRADTTNQGNPDMTTPASVPTGATPAAPAAASDVLTRSDAPLAQPTGVLTNASTFDPAAFAARSAEIVTIGRQAHLPDDVITRAVADPSVTLDAFRAQTLTAMFARQSPGVTLGNDVASRGDRRQAMIDAIVCRTTGTAPTGLAAEYVRHSIADMAHESLVAAGHTLHRNDHDEIFTRTFLQTSDFGEAMLVAARTMLTTIGGQRELEYTRVAKRRDFSNFLPNKLIDVDSFPRLKLLKESGEIQAGTFGTGSSTALLKTFARSIRVTRQAMVNDGLGIFTEMMDSMGRIIPEQQNDIVFAALMIEAMKVANGQASDLFIPGVNLLPQGANNAAAELNDENLDKAITLMGERKRRDGTFTWVKPKFLVTGFANRAKARRLTTAIVANVTGDVNLHTDLVPVLDPSLKGNSWALLSDPQSGTAALSYGGLTGQNGPKVRPWKEVDDHDAVAAAVILDFHGTAGSSHGIAGSLDLAAYKAAKD